LRSRLRKWSPALKQVKGLKISRNGRINHYVGSLKDRMKIRGMRKHGTWLKEGNLERQTEALIVATHDQAV